MTILDKFMAAFGVWEFDPEKCWGCGLCANTCPSDAIAMESLDI